MVKITAKTTKTLTAVTASTSVTAKETSMSKTSWSKIWMKNHLVISILVRLCVRKVLNSSHWKSFESDRIHLYQTWSPVSLPMEGICFKLSIVLVSYPDPGMASYRPLVRYKFVFILSLTAVASDEMSAKIQSAIPFFLCFLECAIH